ncbi:glycosyltransferase family 39 protein [Myxococcota bacterium]|jgi:hypothetical protein|nr:glycosyltransferase family 39 protein [Myxococcota bacterium]
MRRPLNRRNRAVALALAAIHLALLAATLDVGFSRDESFYFNAAEQYSRWFDVLKETPSKAFSKETVDRVFAYNGEHPALPKILFGASWRLLGSPRDPSVEPWTRSWYHEGKPPKPILGWFRESTAMRLPALLLAAVLVAAIYLFGAEFLGHRAGLAAALLWMFQPHAFWHSHFACFDVPVTAWWFLSAYAFWKSLPSEDGSRRPSPGWAVAAAVSLALALNTKHNAFFFPPLVLAWWLWTRRGAFRLVPTSSGPRLAIPSIPWAFLGYLTITPILYWALWPRLWHDPVGHLKWYFGFHAKHEYYWAYFFGTLYTKPPFPWSFPFAMSAMTIPGPTVILFGIGLVRMAREGLVRGLARIAPVLRRIRDGLPDREPGLLSFLFLNFLVPFAIIAHPSVPIFGGTKHWLHGVPFLCLIAGLGFEAVLRGLPGNADGTGESPEPRGPGRLRRLAWISLSFLLLVGPAAWDTLTHTADGSSYYNAFVGGRAVMGQQGMQREFWGNSAFGALEYLDEALPPNTRVDFHDTTWDAVRMYWRDGLLRRDIVPVWDFRNADVFLFHWHKEFTDLEGDVRRDFGATGPSFVWAPGGVPLLDVWRRPSTAEQP